MSESQHEIHNRLAGQIVASIVKPPLEAGGQMTDVLVLLESVVTGVILVASKQNGTTFVFDKLIEGVTARLAEHRLGNNAPTAGTA